MATIDLYSTCRTVSITYCQYDGTSRCIDWKANLATIGSCPQAGCRSHLKVDYMR
jgi:hypothetical protein